MKEFLVVIKSGIFDKVRAMSIEDVLRCYPCIDSVYCNGVRYY
jgi:hypothetical protein